MPGPTRPSPAAVRRALALAAYRTLGPRFVRHYIEPLRSGRLAGTPARETQTEALARDLDDAHTIKLGYSPLKTRYHYNAVENSILEYFISNPPVAEMAVLDVGSGAGHWIDFYLDMLDARRVVGVELRSEVASALQQKYAGVDAVTVVSADVCDPLPIEGRFDVVNAIGVMFHIVEDERWERAVANLAGRLVPGGVMIVGGQFGPVTHDVGFRRARGGDGAAAGRDGLEVLKRLRSRRRWQRCAAQAGLRQVRYVRTRRSREIDAPESNLLVFRA